MKNNSNRRDFIKKTGLFGLGLSLTPEVLESYCQELLPLNLSDKKIRIGLVGIGERGIVLLQGLLKFDMVDISAICDIRSERVDLAEKTITGTGRANPAKYGKGETDFERMCQKEDLDLIVTATPWKWHTPVCISALNNGKHAATEVPAAITIDECWQLVEAAEKNSRQCVMLENYCYFPDVMLVTNMVANSKFGELVHFEGRTQENWVNENWHIFNQDGTLGWVGENLSRRNCNPYPTHGLGPVARWAGINTGDQFENLVSLGSNSYSLKNAAVKKFGVSHPLAGKEYKQGDTNISLLRTRNGKSFTLYYGGTSPQPWSPEYKLQGSNGTCIGEMLGASGETWKTTKFYFDQPSYGRWQNLSTLMQEYMHPLWKTYGATARAKRVNNWSGTYDYLMFYQLLYAIQKNVKPPMDVYDAACWSAISDLSAKSLLNKSIQVDFPDFTRGKWQDRKSDHFMTF
jgi:hypothetical protein